MTHSGPSLRPALQPCALLAGVLVCLVAVGQEQQPAKPKGQYLEVWYGNKRVYQERRTGRPGQTDGPGVFSPGRAKLSSSADEGQRTAGQGAQAPAPLPAPERLVLPDDPFEMPHGASEPATATRPVKRITGQDVQPPDTKSDADNGAAFAPLDSNDDLTWPAAPGAEERLEVPLPQDVFEPGSLEQTEELPATAGVAEPVAPWQPAPAHPAPAQGVAPAPSHESDKSRGVWIPAEISSMDWLGPGAVGQLIVPFLVALVVLAVCLRLVKTAQQPLCHVSVVNGGVDSTPEVHAAMTNGRRVVTQPVAAPASRVASAPSNSPAEQPIAGDTTQPDASPQLRVVGEQRVEELLNRRAVPRTGPVVPDNDMMTTIFKQNLALREQVPRERFGQYESDADAA